MTRQQPWHVLLIVLIAAIASAAAAMVYANRAARDSEHKWCGIVTTLDDAYRETPPQSPAGRRIAVDLAELRREFDCPPSR